MLAIYHPWREKATSHKGFNIKILQNNYRAIQVLKARLGEADKSIGVNFFGSIGFWREMPKPEDFENATPEDYAPFLNLLAHYVPVEVKKEKPFKFTFKM